MRRKQSSAKLLFLIIISILLLIFAFTYRFDSAGEFRLTNAMQDKSIQKETSVQIQQPAQQKQVLSVQEKKLSVKTYFYGAALVASKQNGVVTYYHQDYLGSTRAQSDASKKKVSSVRSAPFGDDVYDSQNQLSSSNAYKFTGQESDATLYYYGARYYDTSTGRFTQLDPVLDIASPYRYTDNNPLKFIDPTGSVIALPKGYHPVRTSKEELGKSFDTMIQTQMSFTWPWKKVSTIINFVSAADAYLDPFMISGMIGGISSASRFSKARVLSESGTKSLNEAFEAGSFLGEGSMSQVHLIDLDGEKITLAKSAMRRAEYASHIPNGIKLGEEFPIIVNGAHELYQEAGYNFIIREFIGGPVLGGSDCMLIRELELSRGQTFGLSRQLGAFEKKTGHILTDLMPQNIAYRGSQPVVFDFRLVMPEDNTERSIRRYYNLWSVNELTSQANLYEIYEEYMRGYRGD